MLCGSVHADDIIASCDRYAEAATPWRTDRSLGTSGGPSFALTMPIWTLISPSI
jgi:hypothetical protein